MVSALSLVLLCIGPSASKAQTVTADGTISTTSELITNQGSAWSGCYTSTQEGFWGGYSGGPCPGIWTNNVQYNENQIIFSYGNYTLSQTISLANALANSGSGLQINGYNYHWHVKNSNINGQQPGGYDPIAYVGVTLYNRDGTIAEQDIYNYGYYIPDWIAVSGTRTYSSPYSLSKVDNIRLSVTGQDSGYWAGYYGPEFMHFSLTANYSVDPCFSNPLYNPSCPGYGAAFLAATQTTTSSAPTVTYNAASGYTNVILAPDSTRTDPTVQNAGGVELTTTGTITAPDGVPTVSKEAVAAANTQTQEREKREVNPLALGIALNTIRKNAEREQNIVRDVLQRNETETLQNRQSQDALVGDLVSRTQEQSQSIALSMTVNSALSITTNTSRTNQETAQTRNEDSTGQGLSTFGPMSNLQNMLQPRLPETATKENAASSVNKNVQPNTAAGNVDIASIAQTPAGFETYMNSMRDGQFYAPKEIYKGQRTVDNARAERFLNGKSDVLHQMMIEQQYNLR